MASRGLGTLTLDLIAKIGGFEAGMDKAARHADKRMREIERRANAFGKALGAGIAVAGTIIVAGLTAATKAAIDQADAIRDLSIRTGVGTETLSAYGYAASQTGTDIDALGKGLKILAKNAADALNPTSEQAKVFDALGIKVTDATGRLKNLDQLVPEIADKFKQLEDGTTKAALAQALFGKSGLELTEFLNQGSSGLDEFTEKARSLGIIIDSQTAEAADKFKDTVGDLHTAIGGLGLGIAKELLPSLQGAASEMVDLIKEGNLAADIAAVLSAAFSATTAIFRGYTTAVEVTSTAIEYLVNVSAGLKEVNANIQSFGLATGTIADGIAKIKAATAAGDAALADIHNRKPTKTFGVNRNTGTDKAGTGQFANVNQSADQLRIKQLQDALANIGGTKAKGGGGGKSPRIKQLTDEQREAEHLLDTYKGLQESYNQQIALVGQTSDVAKLRYDLENGELAKLNPQQKELLLTLAQTAEQRQKDYDALQKQIDLEATQTENAKQVLADIASERDLLGATIEQQDTYNKLKYAGVDANSAWGKSIIEANHALHEQAKQMAASIEIQDEWRSGLSDAITDFVTGAKSLKESFADFFDDFAAKITRMIAEKWIEQLFGETGSNGGGKAGDGWAGIIGSLFGAFGGGKAGGGSVAPGKLYEVGEGDRPEMLMMRGRQYMIPGNHGTVVPIRGNGGSGAVSQNLNFYYAAPPDPRTQSQTAQRVAFETTRASARNR